MGRPLLPAVGEVHGGTALCGLEIDCCSRPDEVRDVGNVHADLGVVGRWCKG